MKKFSIEYKESVYESLDDKMKDKLSEDYISLKRGILLLLEDSVEDSEKLVDVQNFINRYYENSEENVLVGFVDDAEIFDFYLKYQGDIDELCTKNDYFKDSPEKNNIFSLYGFVIEGTKFAVEKCMKILENELF